MQLNELKKLTGRNPEYMKRKAVVGRMRSRWERTGLLEGLRNDEERDNMAIVLDRQAQQLIRESTQTGTTAGSEEWNGVALPLVRRAFQSLLAQELVSVQPQALPSGLVFWVEAKYGTGQPGFTTGSGNTSQADSLYGITGKDANGALPSGGLYGSGRFGYTLNESVTSTLTLSSSVSSTQFTTSSVSESDYDFDSKFYNSYSASIAAGQVFKVSVSSASLSNHNTNAIRSFLTSGTGFVGYFPQFTKANSTDTIITFVVSGSATAVNNVIVKYNKQPTSADRGDFEDRTGTLDIPEVNISFRSEPIVAHTRKVKAVWTTEMEQDIDAYHHIDIEREVTSTISEYVGNEIDLEILDMLVKNAGTLGHWSARTGTYYDKLTSTFTEMSTVASQASAYNQQDWFQTLGTVISDASNKIHQKTLKGGASFAVVSPAVATIFESMNGFNSDGYEANSMTYNFGAQAVGTFRNQIKIYKVPYFLDNTILLGLRGASSSETGAVYAPFIPLISTDVVLDPDTFTPRRGFMTRYATKMIRPEFYGLIKIKHLADIAG